MDISDSIFEDSHSNGGHNDVMMAGEPLGGNFPLQYQLPDLPTFPEEFLDLTPRPHAMPVIDPFSVTESFLTDQVGVEIELDRPSALSAEEIVDGYLPTKDTEEQFSRLHVLVCGYCHSVFHVVDEFNSHLRKCSGVKTNLYCSDLSASALALVLWSNTIHRKLRMKPSLTHLTSTDFLAYSIQQKWFRLSKKTKCVWETAARTLLQLGKDGKLVFPREGETRVRDVGSRSHSGSSGGLHGWPETWRNPEEIGQEDEIQQEMIQIDSIKQEISHLDQVQESELSSTLPVRTSSRVRDRQSSSSLPIHPELAKPVRKKDRLEKADNRNASKREKWKETRRNSSGKWHKEKPVEDEESVLRCDKCQYETREVWKMNRHEGTVKHKRLVEQEEVKRTNGDGENTLELNGLEVEEEEGHNSEEVMDVPENRLLDTNDVGNSSMNVATPRCDISPVSQNVEECLLKRKKFKLFIHNNEQKGEEENGDFLESSRRVESPAIVRMDGRNESEESSDLDDSSSGEIRNESILERVTECSVDQVSSTAKEELTETVLEKVNEDSVLSVDHKSNYDKKTKSVNKGGSRSKVKPRTGRVDPVLTERTGDRKPSKRKSAIAAKGKVSSWIQGHSLGTPGSLEEVVMKDSNRDKRKSLILDQGKRSSTYKDLMLIKKDLPVESAEQREKRGEIDNASQWCKISLHGKRKRVGENKSQEAAKSETASLVHGKRKSAIENKSQEAEKSETASLVHGKRKRVVESKSQEAAKSETASLVHGKRKSAIAAQGKVSCWAQGQSLDDYKKESPSKKLKPNQTKPVPKPSPHLSNNEKSNSVSYARGLAVKLNGKVLSAGPKISDLPTINVQKVKIDEEMLQKLQLNRLESESVADLSRLVETGSAENTFTKLDDKMQLVPKCSSILEPEPELSKLTSTSSLDKTAPVNVAADSAVQEGGIETASLKVATCPGELKYSKFFTFQSRTPTGASSPIPHAILNVLESTPTAASSPIPHAKLNVLDQRADTVQDVLDWRKVTVQYQAGTVQGEKVDVLDHINDTGKDKKGEKAATVPAEGDDTIQAERDDTLQTERDDTIEAERDFTLQAERDDALQAERDGTIQALRDDITIQAERDDTIQAERDDSLRVEKDATLQVERDDTSQAETDDALRAEKDDTLQAERDDTSKEYRSDHGKDSDEKAVTTKVERVHSATKHGLDQINYGTVQDHKAATAQLERAEAAKEDHKANIANTLKQNLALTDKSVSQELPILLDEETKTNNSPSTETSSVEPHGRSQKPTILGHRQTSNQGNRNTPSEGSPQSSLEGHRSAPSEGSPQSSLEGHTTISSRGISQSSGPGVISSHQTIRFQPPILAKKSAPPREPGELPRASSILKDPHLRVKTRVPTTAQTVHNKYAYHQGIHLLKPEVIVPSKTVKTIVGTVRAKQVVVDETKGLTACLPKGYEMVKQQIGSKTEFCLIKKPQIPTNVTLNQPKSIMSEEQQLSNLPRQRVAKPKILQHQMKSNIVSTPQNEAPSPVSAVSGQSYLPGGSPSTASTPFQEQLRYRVASSANVQNSSSHSLEAVDPDQSFEMVGDRLPMPNQSLKDEIGFLANQRALPTTTSVGQSKIQYIESAIPQTKSVNSTKVLAVTRPRESGSAGVIKPTQQLKVQPVATQQLGGRKTSKVMIQLPGGNKMIADLTQEQLKNLNITNLKTQVDAYPSVNSPIVSSIPTGHVASMPDRNTSMPSVELRKRSEIANIAPYQHASTEQFQKQATNPNEQSLTSRDVSSAPYREGEHTPVQPMPHGIKNKTYSEAPFLEQYSSHQLFESAMKEPPVEGSTYYQTTNTAMEATAQGSSYYAATSMAKEATAQGSLYYPATCISKEIPVEGSTNYYQTTNTVKEPSAQGSTFYQATNTEKEPPSQGSTYIQPSGTIKNSPIVGSSCYQASDAMKKVPLEEATYYQPSNTLEEPTVEGSNDHLAGSSGEKNKNMPLL